MDSLIGTTIDDKYEVRRLIGRGGMGAVYEGFHQQMQMPVAIKVLLAKTGLTQDALTRFANEAKSASTVSHPNVVSTQAFGMIRDVGPFIVMELLRGRSLADDLNEHGTLNRARFLSIFSQCCDALAEVHDRGYVHRDIKPSNIMLVEAADDAVSVKITDFGIAKLFGDQSMQALTRTGEILGTPLYMSPEQCMGKPVDQRSDIYSLGCVMYEALTGSAPFLGESAMEVMLSHVEGSAVPPSIGGAVGRVVMRALEKDPESRPQTMRDLGAELSQAAEEGDIMVVATSSAHARKPIPVAKLMVAGIAVITIASVAVIAYRAMTTQPKQHQAAHLRQYLRDKFDPGKLSSYDSAIEGARTDFDEEPDSMTAIQAMRDAIVLQRHIGGYYEKLAARNDATMAQYDRLTKLYEQLPERYHPPGLSDAAVKLASFCDPGSAEREKWLKVAWKTQHFLEPANDAKCNWLLGDLAFEKNQMANAMAWYSKALELATARPVASEILDTMEETEIAALLGRFRCAQMEGDLNTVNQTADAALHRLSTMQPAGQQKYEYTIIAEAAAVNADAHKLKRARDLLARLPAAEFRRAKKRRVMLMQAVAHYAAGMCAKDEGAEADAHAEFAEAKEFLKQVPGNDIRTRFWRQRIERM